MAIKEIEAKSILTKHKKIDSWFISHYGMNLYRGCLHNCIYCDGRGESYYVDGEFGEDVVAKINAVEILENELDPKRKRSPLKKSYIMLGGGVGDSYQPIESKYQLSQKVLQLIYKYNLPVHILTKSILVKRDVDLLKKINEKNKVIVSFSFSSVDNKISSIFEPNVPSPEEKLKILAFFKKEGIACGMFLLPVIPFITDTPELIEEAIKKAKENGIDFIIFGGMTLKEGRQKEYFFNVLRKTYPKLITEYESIYKDNKWGGAEKEYYDSINLTFNSIAKKYKMPIRIPHYLFKDILDENDLVIVVLEHIDYFLKMQGKKSSFSYAGYSISQLKQSLSSMKGELQKIKGVGKITEKIILEILKTGSSSYLEELLKSVITKS
ncbi:MAG: radical SAM protein [Candidatus Firestonebacteria bacterium]